MESWLCYVTKYNHGQVPASIQAQFPNCPRGEVSSAYLVGLLERSDETVHAQHPAQCPAQMLMKIFPQSLLLPGLPQRVTDSVEPPKE